jgi:hypothetical protein
MATARKTDRTYQSRKDDGSVETRHFYEVVNGDEVTEFFGGGAAEFTADCANGKWERGKAYNGASIV